MALSKILSSVWFAFSLATAVMGVALFRDGGPSTMALVGGGAELALAMLGLVMCWLTWTERI